MTAKSLPSGYAQIDRWSLKQASRRDVLLVGVVGLVIMLMSLAAASFVVEATSDSDVITLEGEVFIIGLGVGTVLGIVLHELVHGVFFFVFGGRPRFGFKPWTRFGPVFYAAAPGKSRSVNPTGLSHLLLPATLYITFGTGSYGKGKGIGL